MLHGLGLGRQGRNSKDLKQSLKQAGKEVGGKGGLG